MKTKIYKASCAYSNFEYKDGIDKCANCWHFKRFNDNSDMCDDIKLDWLDYLMVKEHVIILGSYYEE